jgi:hypothetical protein
MWTQAEAIELCKQIEAIAPRYGAHVALTGGLLYKNGPRKDADILLYRIRQIQEVDWTSLFDMLQERLGVILVADFGWCKKATWRGKDIDFFDPDAGGDYGNGPDDQVPEHVEFL